MYDDSAGAMYEQEEYARKEALRRKKLLIRNIPYFNKCIKRRSN